MIFFLMSRSTASSSSKWIKMNVNQRQFATMVPVVVYDPLFQWNKPKLKDKLGISKSWFTCSPCLGLIKITITIMMFSKFLSKTNASNEQTAVGANLVACWKFLWDAGMLNCVFYFMYVLL